MPALRLYSAVTGVFALFVSLSSAAAQAQLLDQSYKAQRWNLRTHSLNAYHSALQRPNTFSQLATTGGGHHLEKRGLKVPTKLKIFRLHLKNPNMISKMLTDPKGYVKHLDDVTRKSKLLTGRVQSDTTIGAGLMGRMQSARSDDARVLQENLRAKRSTMYS